jgi:hypothetical protein
VQKLGGGGFVYHVKQPVLTLGAEALVRFGFVRVVIVALILETASSLHSRILARSERHKLPF